MLRTEQEMIAALGGPDHEPLVSVICFTYNHERFIEDALRGFLIQETDFPFEVIVHDDASEDGTAAIVRRWAEAYPTIIRPIFQEVNQYSRGRKLLTITMPTARGRYIALCEGDDYWTDPRKLQIQADFLEKNPDYVVCYHDVKVISEDGGVLSTSLLSRNGGADRRDFSALEMQKLHGYIQTLTVVFRNVAAKFPDEYIMSPAGDRFLMSLLGGHGKGKYIDINAGCYRVHSGGMYSGKTQIEKDIAFFLSRYYLYIYYTRIGNKDLGDHFWYRVALLLLRSPNSDVQIPTIRARLRLARLILSPGFVNRGLRRIRRLLSIISGQGARARRALTDR